MRKKVVKAASWQGMLELSTQITNLIVFVILARLLTPSDFGLISMVAVFHTFLTLIQDFGLISAVIQKKN